MIFATKPLMRIPISTRVARVRPSSSTGSSSLRMRLTPARYRVVCCAAAETAASGNCGKCCGGGRCRGSSRENTPTLSVRHSGRGRQPRSRGWRRHGTIWYRVDVVMPLVPSQMEDPMCWEIDYKFFEQQKKAQEARMKQEQRTGVINRLLTEANEQGEKIEAT